MSAHDPVARTAVRGKFLVSGGTKFYVRGLTYGSVRPDRDGSDFPDEETVERDLARMAAIRANAIRVGTVPPAWLLDAAWRHGIHVMVGLPVERWLGRLLDGGRMSDLEELVRRGVRDCVGHPSLLCYAIGDEVQAPIVNWLGRRRTERLLHRLYSIAKAEDPDTLVTYVNSVTGASLSLGFLDLVTFKVGLDTGPQLESELLGLQGIAGDRPLLVELTLDAVRSGDGRPGSRLGAPLRSALASGCAGAFVNGAIGDLGTIVDPIAAAHDSERDAQGNGDTRKPALGLVRSAFASVPFPVRRRWPRVTVAVCTRDSSGSLRDCLDGIRDLEYPDYETIVVDSGSTDDTRAIARAHWARLVRSPDGGLAASRNAALKAATGEIVAFVDDNIVPDPHWLTYLVAAFGAGDHVAVGGPVIARPEDGLVAECVANSPGNPGPALISDGEAEVIPASNVAYRRAKLLAIGAFDPAFTASGGDIDVSWRLRDQGWTLGFSPGAVVWRPAASTIRGYWDEQRAAGMTEGLLEKKWPQRFTVRGQASPGPYRSGNAAPPAQTRYRGYQSLWGVGAVESRPDLKPRTAEIVLTPEWYLLIASLLFLTVLGIGWTPLLLAGPLLILAVLASILQAFRAAGRARYQGQNPGLRRRVMRRAMTAFLTLLQPAARLRGRIQAGLTPWRRKRLVRITLPRRHTLRFWAMTRPHDIWVRSIHDALTEGAAAVVGIRPDDTFDLEGRGGTFGAARLMVALEAHPGDRELVRLRVWPRWTVWARALASLFLLAAAVALADGAWAIAGVFGLLAAEVALSAYSQSIAALSDLRQAVEQQVRATALEDAPPVAVTDRSRAAATQTTAQALSVTPAGTRLATAPRRPRNSGIASPRNLASSNACPKCGLVLAPTAMFCRRCGERQVRARPRKTARRQGRISGSTPISRRATPSRPRPSTE